MAAALARGLKSTFESRVSEISSELPPQVEERHELVFRPRARLVSILGDQLISDPAVGLIELVKNSYDADATEVVVEVSNTSSEEETTVVVHDNGIGMSLDDIKTKWLSPAVSHKEQRKKNLERTALGRLPIGEKGVGRFAVHKLGIKLKMITRTSSDKEVVLNIDWSHFDNPENYLDGVGFEVVIREPEVFTGDETGTRIVMQEARQPWNVKLLKKTHRALRRLQSPVGENGSDFNVKFRCPEHPELEDIAPDKILDSAHYTFSAEVSDTGQCRYSYKCSHPELEERRHEGEQCLVSLAANELQGVAPASGPFKFRFHVWQRTREHLRASGVSPRELDAICGVSLYRDGLRVYPYGEPGNDWLLLDQERIQAPSEKLGNNQVVGIIHLDQVDNLKLRDKTNREGLIENEAFLDLRALIRACIRLFSSFWKRDRPGELNNAVPPQITSQETTRLLMCALRDSAREDVYVKIPGRIDGVVPQNGSRVSQKAAAEALLEQFDGVDHVLKERKKKIELLENLAATGLAAERVANEFGRQVVGVFEALDRLRPKFKSNGQAPAEWQALENALKALQEQSRELVPYETSGRRQATREVSVREACEIALNLNHERFRRQGIEVVLRGQDFRVKARPASLVQVLDNLLDNAKFWLSTLESPKQVGIHLCDINHRLILWDNGPGVSEQARSQIFDPFFSMRNDAKGLGLHLASELMGSMDGHIELLDGDSKARLQGATGAAFALQFPIPQNMGQRSAPVQLSLYD
jgi:signal transduction histidine kinase